MELLTAIPIFAALAQETRLQAFRLLVEAGSAGLPAGELSKTLQIPNNTLSFHLSQLSNAGVISSRKQGRSIIYSANYAAVQDLISFLIRDCCSSDVASIRTDEKPGFSIIELADCCPPRHN